MELTMFLIISTLFILIIGYYRARLLDRNKQSEKARQWMEIEFAKAKVINGRWTFENKAYARLTESQKKEADRLIEIARKDKRYIEALDSMRSVAS